MVEPIIPTEPVNPPIVSRADDPNASVRAERDALVTEIKTLRTEKQDLINAGKSTIDVDRKIADALLAREQEDADKNWVKAQDAFIAKNKEFHPENDPGGVKKALLERELKLLNRSGLTTVDELTSILERAKILATSGVRSETTQVRIDPSIPRSNPEPKASDTNGLSPKELRVIENLNSLGASTWTPERFLKLKAKDPAFVERALTQFS